MIETLYELAREVTAFNMAGSFKDVPHDHKIAYAKIDDILDFCKALTPRVILRSDYSTIDFTVTLFK